MAAESEFPLLRAAGEMPWVLPQPEGAEDFFVYESAVNKIVEDKPAVFMCMYDLDRFGVSMLVDVLNDPSQGATGRNGPRQPSLSAPRGSIWRPRPPPPRPGTPLPRFEGRGTRVIATDPLQSLTESDSRIAELVASGMTNRSIAEYLILVAPHGRRTPQAHLHQARHPLTRRTHGVGPGAWRVGSGRLHSTVSGVQNSKMLRCRSSYPQAGAGVAAAEPGTLSHI